MYKATKTDKGRGWKAIEKAKWDIKKIEWDIDFLTEELLKIEKSVYTIVFVMFGASAAYNKKTCLAHLGKNKSNMSKLA